MFLLPLELFCIMTWFKNTFIQTTVIGLLLGVGFLWSSFWWVSLLGGVWFVSFVQQHKNIVPLFLGSWWVWTVKSACAAWVTWSVYPIEWLPVEFGNVQFLSIGLYWSTIAIWLGCGGLFFAFVIYVARRFGKLYELWLLPLAWVFGEVLGSLVFSIFFIGPGGGVNAAYSFGYAGYHLVEQPFLFLFASVAGVYALSFLFALLVLAGYSTLNLAPRWKLLFGVISVLLVVTSWREDYIYQTPDSADTKVVAVVETDFSSQFTRDKNNALRRQSVIRAATEAAFEIEPDYIIFPEDSRLLDQSRSTRVNLRELKQQYGNNKSLVVDSGRVVENDKVVLQAALYDSNTNGVAVAQKRYLVPQGEYMPTVYRWLYSAIGYGDLVSFLDDRLSYQVGDKISQSDFTEVMPAVLFCFESTDPRGVRTLMNEHPEAPFVAHPISHAWFHQPESLWQQFDAMLRTQARWNDALIISAGNMVPSKVYTKTGSVYVPEIVAEGELWRVRRVVIEG